MNTSIIIDKLTKSIEDVATGKSLDTEIVRLKKSDLGKVLKKLGWQFGWKDEMSHSERQVYKLVIKGESTIQGLISLQVMESFIEMHLIESSPQNFGHNKKYAGVAGNMIAFACKVSFDLGFQGYLAFTPKTDLIKHYQETLGAELIYRNRMRIASIPARKLVNSYYESYFKI